MPPDPFRNSDPRWQPWEVGKPYGRDDSDLFSQPDITTRSVKDFLRTIEVPRQPPSPDRQPFLEGRVLPHIQGFPQ
jgi:hypothetical protein